MGDDSIVKNAVNLTGTIVMYVHRTPYSSQNTPYTMPQEGDLLMDTPTTSNWNELCVV